MCAEMTFSLIAYLGSMFMDNKASDHTCSITGPAVSVVSSSSQASGAQSGENDVLTKYIYIWC